MIFKLLSFAFGIISETHPVLISQFFFLPDASESEYLELLRFDIDFVVIVI